MSDRTPDGPAGEPTLGALVRARFGVRPAVTAAALVLLTAGALAFATLRAAADGRSRLTHEGPPAFRILYDADHVRAAEPAPRELARLEARGRAEAYLTVLPLPDSDLPFGGLPIFAERRLAALRAELPRVRVQSEGKARVHGAPAYRIVYRAGPAGSRLRGRDVLVYPDERDLRGGLLLRLREEPVAGRLGPRAREARAQLRRAMRFFEFEGSPR